MVVFPQTPQLAVAVNIRRRSSRSTDRRVVTVTTL